MAFAAVYIPEFPVVAFLRAQPRSEPSAQPIREALAILEGKPPLERVVALNRATQKLGITHGVSKVQAEAAGSLRFRTRQPAEEAEAFAAVLTLAERFSPRVQAIASPENNYANAHRLCTTLLLDRSGTGTLFGTAESYARRLHRELKVAGFPARVAAAPNAEATLLLARSYPGVTCAEGPAVEAKLAPLPITALPCAEATQTVFRQWGIRTLGELARLPEAALISRIGQIGRRLQQLARGHAEHLLVPEETEFTLTETAALDTPLEMLDSFLFVLSPLLDSLLRKAVEHAYALRTLQLSLTLERAEPYTLQIRPAVPTQSRDLVLKLLNLELQAHPPQAGITAITLSAEPTQPQTAQRGLFQAQFPEPDRLDLLLARLRSIAGEGNVGSPELRDTHSDDAFTIAPFNPHLSTAPLDNAPPDNATPDRLALRRLRPPQPVRVVLQNGQPQLLFWRGARLLTTVASGPWHSSGCWWDGRTWADDEWDIIIAQPPQILRLKLEHATQTWFVVGIYD